MKEIDNFTGDLPVLLARAEEEMAVEDAARIDPRWERLLAGTLDDEEATALAAEARASEDAARLYETFRPLSGDFHEAVIQALQNQPGGGAAITRQTARVLPFRRPGQWIAGLAAAAAAMAALLLFVLGGRGALPPLPAYQVSLLGGSQELRSGEEPPADIPRRYVAGDRFEVLLRPQAEVAGEVVVRCFLARGEEIHPFAVPTEISQQGSVRLAGEVGREVEVGVGSWTLWLAIGRAGTLPGVEQLRAHLAASSREPWSLYRTSFEVIPLPVE